MQNTRELFAIHASKDGNWIESQDTSPTLTVAKANGLRKTGWDVTSRTRATDDMGRQGSMTSVVRPKTTDQVLA
jgi:hypothetical protein